MLEDIEILLVEDDEDDAEQIILLLRRNISSNIRHIDNGESALQFIMSPGSERLKVIFLDLVLPGVHGIEILQRMKADPIKSKIPVIILSSYKGKEYVNSFGLSASGYFDKHHVITKSAEGLSKMLVEILNQDRKILVPVNA